MRAVAQVAGIARFEDFGRSQAFPPPPDLRAWVPAIELAHVVAAAVEGVEISAFKVDRCGTGKAMDHPRLMPASPTYGYADGIVSSRRLERASSRDLAVRFVTANSRPDRATIAALPREHQQAIARAFAEVPLMAREVGPLRLGTVSLDGTKLEAEARAEAEAEAAGDDDTDDYGDGAGDARSAPAEVRPPPERQTNLTDPDSALVRRSRRHEFRQAYDAHTTVDADDGQLVLATAVALTPSDAPTVQAIVDALEAVLGRCETILADAGFAEVKTERGLLSLADNCKRLRKLMAARRGPQPRDGRRPVRPSSRIRQGVGGVRPDRSSGRLASARPGPRAPPVAPRRK